MPIKIPEKINLLIFNKYLKEIEKLLLSYKISCFIAYSWGNSDHQVKVARLANDLLKAGIIILFDLQDNSEVNSNIPEFTSNIDVAKYVILFGSKILMQKYNEKRKCIINQEIEKIRNKFSLDSGSVIGLSFSYGYRDCLPGFLTDRVIPTYTNEFDEYSKVTFDLLLYFSPNEIKKSVQLIFDSFWDEIHSIKYRMSYEKLLECNSMISLQLLDQKTILAEDLLKKDYLKKFNSSDIENFVTSYVTLTCQDNEQKTIQPSESIKYKYEKLIFDLCGEKRNIVVQGDYGMGKSTLCKSIVYLWASNKILSDFKFVFFIDASNLTASRYPDSGKKYKEIDFIIQECFLEPPMDISKIILESNIDYSKHKILWIIDEVDGLFNNVPQHLQDIFNSIKSSPYTILTTRSSTINFPYYQYYQINKLSRDSQERHIKSFFRSPKYINAKNSLIRFLNNNILIANLCLIPAYLEIVCNIWQKNLHITNENHNKGITKIYEEIFTSMINKFLIEKEGLQAGRFSTEYEISRLHLVLSVLQEIAFFLYKENRDILTYNEFEAHASKLLKSSSHAQQLPYLFKHILQIGIIIKNGNNLKFIDPSLKMFFVAKYFMYDLKKTSDISNHQYFKDRFSSVVINDKYIKNNDLLFSFISGLLGSLNKDNDFSGSLFIKEINMLFWANIFSDNLDFIGINHTYLLLKCLKEADYNIILTEQPQIKSYIYKRLPNILRYITFNKINYPISMFLSIFDDPDAMEIIIISDLLKEVIEFIIYADCDYESTILSDLIANCKPYYRKKIVGFIKETLLKTTPSVRSYAYIRYFAVSMQNNYEDNKNLLLSLLAGSLYNKRTALEMMLVQNIYNQEIIEILIKLATDISPLITKPLREKIYLIDASDKKQLIENENVILELMEMDRYSFFCIDILYKHYGYTTTFLEILERIYIKTTSEYIREKIISMHLELTENLVIISELEDDDYSDTCSEISSEDNYLDYLEIYCQVDNGYIDNVELIHNLYKRINWRKTTLNCKILYKLDEKVLNFFIDNNIFLVKIPLENLINTYARHQDNILLGKLIAKRIFFNCSNEVLTIKNDGIMIYREKAIFISKDDLGLDQPGYIAFIRRFANLLYSFATESNFNLYHKGISLSFYGLNRSNLCTFIYGDQTNYYVCEDMIPYKYNSITTTKSLNSDQSISEENLSVSGDSTLGDSLIVRQYTNRSKRSDSRSSIETPTLTNNSNSNFYFRTAGYFYK